MVRLLTTVLFLSLVPSMSVSDAYDDLYAALKFDKVVDIIVQEGRDEAGDVANTYLEPQHHSDFIDKLAAYYEKARIAEQVKDLLREKVTSQDADRALAFYLTESGQLFAGLEVSARAAIMDQGVQEAAIEMAKSAASQEDPKAAQIAKLISDMDWINKNMVSVFESQYAFLIRLAEVEGFNLNQAAIFDLLSEQENEIRTGINEWLQGFLFMAYAPTTLEQVTEYFAFLNSPTGRVLDAAFFDVFDQIDYGASVLMGTEVAAILSLQNL